MFRLTFWEIFSLLLNISLGMCFDTSTRLLPLWNHGAFTLCPYIWALNSEWWQLHKWGATGICRKDNSKSRISGPYYTLSAGHGFDTHYAGTLTGLIYRWAVIQKLAQGCAARARRGIQTVCLQTLYSFNHAALLHNYGSKGGKLRHLPLFCDLRGSGYFLLDVSLFFCLNSPSPPYPLFLGKTRYKRSED